MSGWGLVSTSSCPLGWLQPVSCLPQPGTFRPASLLQKCGLGPLCPPGRTGHSRRFHLASTPHCLSLERSPQSLSLVSCPGGGEGDSRAKAARSGSRTGDRTRQGTGSDGGRPLPLRGDSRRGQNGDKDCEDPLPPARNLLCDRHQRVTSTSHGMADRVAERVMLQSHREGPRARVCVCAGRYSYVCAHTHTDVCTVRINTHHAGQARTRKALTSQGTKNEVGILQRQAPAKAGSARGARLPSPVAWTFLRQDHIWLWGGRKARACPAPESDRGPTWSRGSPRAVTSRLK